MKKTLKILKSISTIIGAIVLIFFVIGLIVWGIDFDSIRYGRNEEVNPYNIDNEGPFVFKTDSLYQIKFIKGNSEKGFYLKERIEENNTEFTLECYYHIDSSDFSFTLQPFSTDEKYEFEAPNKIIAISDIESNYKTFRDFLIVNKVIDKELNWIFGNGHLVLNGDFVDRSYFTTQVLWFIYKLEQEAEKNGGMVHYILGNHEIMNIQGDNRYSKSKYKNVSAILGLKQFQLYDTTMYLGQWLNKKNVIEKIGSYLFVHAGLSPELVNERVELEEINRISRNNYQKAYYPKQNQNQKESLVLSSQTSPYWYRGYFEDDLQQSQIDKILDYYDCSQIIVGHTIQDKVNRIFDGKIIGIDVEHPKDYYKYFPKLHAQGLLIENKKFYRIDDEGKKTEI